MVPLAFVPASSRLRMLTERASSSSWPTTTECTSVSVRELVLCDTPKMKLYWAISPLRIFLGKVLSLLSTSAKRPREFRCTVIPAAYSFCQKSSEMGLETCDREITHIRSSDRDNNNLTRRQPEGPVCFSVIFGFQNLQERTIFHRNVP